MAKLYAFERGEATRIRKKNQRSKSGGVGGDATLLPKSGGGSPLKYFKLLEDGTSLYGPSWARLTDRTASENGTIIALYWWEGLLVGAQPGYHGLCSKVDGDWTFVQGPCIYPCESSGTISPGDPPDGEVGAVYAGHVVSSTNLNLGTLSATGMPPGLSMDTSGLVSGTPTTAGTYYAIVTGTAPGTGDNENGTCTITAVLRITVTEAP